MSYSAIILVMLLGGLGRLLKTVEAPFGLSGCGSAETCAGSLARSLDGSSRSLRMAHDRQNVQLCGLRQALANCGHSSDTEPRFAGSAQFTWPILLPDR